MCGRFGWDCHGLPIEYEIDQKLGITSPKQVEEMGIAAYNGHCRSIVSRYCSEWETIEKFADYITNAGYASPIRTPRGRDILAACGQLKSESERMKKTDRMAFEAMMIAGHGEE